jgi:hypothetical protein
MPYVFQSSNLLGKPHPRWRFQYTDWKGRRRTATGTTSEADTRKLALAVQSEGRHSPGMEAGTKGIRPSEAARRGRR